MTQARNPPADEGERKVSDAVERARQQWESTLPNGADESEDAAFLAGWAARETEEKQWEQWDEEEIAQLSEDDVRSLAVRLSHLSRSLAKANSEYHDEVAQTRNL